MRNSVIWALSVLLVVGMVLSGACAGSQTGAPSQETRTFENITPREAFTLIQDNEGNPDFVILDVRTPQEVANGHIENSINLDFYSKTFREELDRLDKNKTYLVYCRSGNRSGQAAAIMDKINFKEIYNMTGGIAQWQAEGLPTTK